MPEAFRKIDAFRQSNFVTSGACADEVSGTQKPARSRTVRSSLGYRSNVSGFTRFVVRAELVRA